MQTRLLLVLFCEAGETRLSVVKCLVWIKAIAEFSNLAETFLR